MAEVPCICDGAVCVDPRPFGPVDARKALPVWRTYVCPGCGREVPWCFGAADDMAEVCDDCWWVRTKVNEEAGIPRGDVVRREVAGG